MPGIFKAGITKKAEINPCPSGAYFLACREQSIKCKQTKKVNWIEGDKWSEGKIQEGKTGHESFNFE